MAVARARSDYTRRLHERRDDRLDDEAKSESTSVMSVSERKCPSRQDRADSSRRMACPLRSGPPWGKLLSLWRMSGMPRKKHQPEEIVAKLSRSTCCCRRGARWRKRSAQFP